MAVVRLDGNAISDWAAFHRACKQAFGFPEFYGANMDAWVDSLSYLRDEENMTKFLLKPDEKLQIVIANSAALRTQAPDILADLSFCVEAINERYADYGEHPALELKLD